MKKQITLAWLTCVCMLALSGCALYKPMEPLPGVLTPPPEGVSLKLTLTDYDGLVYAQGVKLVLSGRVANLERGDLAMALGGSALASGAGVASAGGAAADVIAAIMSVGALLNSAMAIINPAVRANALSEGNTMTLQAESRYVLCIAAAGITRVSRSKLSPCGAQLVADVNSAIAATNRALVGLMPTAFDSPRLDNPAARPQNIAPEIVKAINSEPDTAAR